MGKRSIVEGITPQARRARRRELGPLRDLVIKPATKKRYEEAARKFFAYLKANKEPLPTQPHALDQIVGHYLEELWWDGQSKSLAGDTLSSLQHREPSLKGQLRWSWKLLKAWQQAEVPSRAPPFTLQTLAIFCGWAHSTKPSWALGLQVAFHGLLRTGELLQLQAKHITCKQQFIHLHLGQTKTSFRNANVDSVHFAHSQVSLLLQAWKSVARDTDYLIDASSTTFRAWFASGLSATGLVRLDFKPYSLRRGGATQLFSDTQSYSTVTQRGRWSSTKTVRVYVADSLALLQELTFNISQNQRFFIQQWNKVLNELERSRSRSSGGRG